MNKKIQCEGSFQERSFTKIENDVIEADISVYALAVYVAIRRHINGVNLAWPGYRRIAGMAGCSRRQVRRALEELRNRGFIIQERRNGISNLYSIPKGDTCEGPPKAEVVPPKDQGVACEARGCGLTDQGVWPVRPPNKTKEEEINKEREGLEKKTVNSPSPFDSLKEIRQRRYSDLTDLKYQIYSKNDLIIDFIRNNDSEALELAYTEYIQSDEKGLIKSSHSTAIFLSQLDEWYSRSKESQPGLFDYKPKYCGDCGKKYVGSFCLSCGWDPDEPISKTEELDSIDNEKWKDFTEGKKTMWQIIVENSKNKKAEEVQREKEKAS